MDNEVLKAIRERRSIRRYLPDQIKDEELKAVLEAGTWAPTGKGTQDPIIIAVQDPEICKVLRRLNAEVWGRTDFDPYYGAPTIILVFSRAENPNCVKDGSLVIGNILLAAHSIGLGACWINRCQEMFESEEGKALAPRLGIPVGYEGVGSVSLGYIEHAAPAPRPRKADYYKIV
jgi:nitroreductase